MYQLYPQWPIYVKYRPMAIAIGFDHRLDLRNTVHEQHPEGVICSRCSPLACPMVFDSALWQSENRTSIATTVNGGFEVVISLWERFSKCFPLIRRQFFPSFWQVKSFQSTSNWFILSKLEPERRGERNLIFIVKQWGSWYRISSSFFFIYVKSQLDLLPLFMPLRGGRVVNELVKQTQDSHPGDRFPCPAWNQDNVDFFPLSFTYILHTYLTNDNNIDVLLHKSYKLKPQLTETKSFCCLNCFCKL